MIADSDMLKCDRYLRINFGWCLPVLPASNNLDENFSPVPTHFQPVLTSITPVSRLFTYITHTHTKIKSDAILKLRAP